MNELQTSFDRQITKNMNVFDISKSTIVDLFNYQVFKYMVIVFGLLALWSFISLFSVFSALSFSHEVSPYGVDKFGRILVVIPLDKPNKKTEKVLKLYSNFIEETLSFNYVQYQSELNRSGQLYFTEKGFTAFALELKKQDGLIDFVDRNSSVTTAMGRGIPQLIGEKVWNGRYAWKIKMVVSLDFAGFSVRKSGKIDKSKGRKYFIATGVVVRQPVALYEDGLAISNLNLKPIKAGDL